MSLSIYFLVFVQVSLLSSNLSSAQSTDAQKSENSSTQSPPERKPYRYHVTNPFFNTPNRLLIKYNDNPFFEESSNTNKRNGDSPTLRLDPSNHPRGQKPMDDSNIQTTSRSQMKCNEYHNGMQKMKRSGVALMGTNKTLPLPETAPPELSLRHLVVGGRRALPHKYPHIVALGKRKESENFSFQCGGSLISPKWILTAAHCTHGRGSVNVARLGVDRLSENGDEIIPIKRTIRHPSYKPPAKYADIALLELQRSVNFNDKIKPACLHQDFQLVPPSAWICGWGALEFGEEKSDTLQEAMLDIVDTMSCAMRYNGSSTAVPNGIVPSMICAGAPSAGWTRDACQGDSGGPLQIPHSTNRNFYEIIGITSFGMGCAFPDTPGVYSRVSHYLDWIENIVWPIDE